MIAYNCYTLLCSKKTWSIIRFLAYKKVNIADGALISIKYIKYNKKYKKVWLYINIKLHTYKKIYIFF